MHLQRTESVDSLVTVGVSSDCLAGSLLNVNIGCLQTQSDTLQVGSGMEGLLHDVVGLVLRLCQQACCGHGCCRRSYRGSQVIP